MAVSTNYSITGVVDSSLVSGDGISASLAARRTTGQSILAWFNYANLTIIDTTNITYSQVSDKLRSDGTGKAIKMLAGANGAFGRVHYNVGVNLAQGDPNKLECKGYVDPTHWNYNAVRTAPNVTLRASPDNVTSAATNARTLSVVNANQMPGWNYYSQRFDVGASGGYADWTVIGTMPVDSPVRHSYVAASLAANGDYFEVEMESIGERGTPYLMLMTDSASYVNQALQQEFYDYCNARGVKFTIATRGTYMTPATYAALQRYYAAGNDVIQQGYNDTNWVTSGYANAAAVAAVFRGEVQQTDALLASLGLERGRRAMFSYPQNAFVNELNDVLLNEFGFKSIRVARGSAVNGTPGGRLITPFVNSRDMGGSWTDAVEGAAWTDAALNSGHGLCVYLHEIVADSATPTSLQTRIGDAKRFVDRWVNAINAGLAVSVTASTRLTLFPMAA